jgi:predicted amidophosphoribosyltransferase
LNGRHGMDTCAGLLRAPTQEAGGVPLTALARLLAPPLCGICAAAADPSRHVCERCEHGLARGTAPPLAISGADLAWAARPYAGVARELVAGLKFGCRQGWPSWRPE